MRISLELFITTIVALIADLRMATTSANQGIEAELDSTKGRGLASAARILKAREHGPFKDWADLGLRVQDLTNHRAERLTLPGLTVNGLTFEPARVSTARP
jgi:hypothetical protein